MPAPTYTKVAFNGDKRSSILFGGLPVPVGKNLSSSSMSYMDLNDGVSWFAKPIEIGEVHDLALVQALWEGRATIIGEDYKPIVVKVPYRYEEAVNTLASQRGLLAMAGDQYLTFDQGVTGFVARCLSSAPKMDVNFVDPQRWSGDLHFLCREPFIVDIAQTTTTFVSALAAGANNATIAYPGSFRCAPLWRISASSGNTAVVSQIQIQNTDTGQTATINNPFGSGAHTLEIDCATGRVQLDSTTNLDLSGSYPRLWPPTLLAGGLNHITVNVTVSSGVLAASAIVVYQARWYP